MLLIAVARSSSGGVTQSQREGEILGVFFPISNALYSIAFWTHTKTAEPIQMPFGLMTRVGHRYHVLDGGPDAPREGAILGENVEGHCNVIGHSDTLRCTVQKRLNRAACTVLCEDSGRVGSRSTC